MAAKTVVPTFKGKSFTCIHCSTLTTMRWWRLFFNENGYNQRSGLFLCECFNCEKRSIWIPDDEEEETGRLVFPTSISSPRAHDKIPENCASDFEEARCICGDSPRGAAAILRLCLQKLLAHLGGEGEHIDTDIKKLVASGLDPHIQEALDVIRVTGNNAVHPLEMNLEDDQDSVLVLFEMINLIVEERIARPQRIRERFDNLPEKAKAAIEKRDKPKQ
ncbi:MULTISPECIES: DUF4145 domain-containing protein [Pseudomonas]|uniref:DUF4145 domain-containing protein n=1 Tax=Pseudomonas quercus TaxID=2722792 RepID=A0ABX0YIH3_9PSED|nr:MULTISPECIES: DUF4145 domain-containing protein [Pseudomonas]MBF7144136.1 DUF4145 domain-containing protein [Pseudomonas sp. LY10J]NJP02732.1 DUF4145 domain-containing protein [Pseudomonas quercus]